MRSAEDTIFRTGSTTYYFSSKFFPKEIREDVYKLYSFVRIVDNYIDEVPANITGFQQLVIAWKNANEQPSFSTITSPYDSQQERIIKNIVFVSRKYHFESTWVESFIESMQADVDKKKYVTLQDSLWYVYGSAEVIGLMMAQIMGLPVIALPTAQLQGRAMQFINFIRDIDEDNKLGRCYFPRDEMNQYNLQHLIDPRLIKGDISPQLDHFTAFMRFQIERYRQWQLEASEGFKYIPRRFLIPLQTAVDMYDWTAEIIYHNPCAVFDKKIKPTKRHVLTRAGTRTLWNRQRKS
ncbi:MAG: phytoene/squalene synthase family protein [Candidatus Saccharimonadales bacterium]